MASIRFSLAAILCVLVISQELYSEERGILLNGIAFVPDKKGGTVTLTIRRRKKHELTVQIFAREGGNDDLLYKTRIYPHAALEQKIAVGLKPGQYIVTTENHREKQNEYNEKEFALRVIDRSTLKNKQVVICDIDGTVVQERENRLGFLIDIAKGKPSLPLRDAVPVVNRMIDDPEKIVIFLTARPDFITSYTIKKSLLANGFSLAPVVFRQDWQNVSQADSKKAFLKELRAEGIAPEQITFIGNSPSDILAFQEDWIESGRKLGWSKDRLFILPLTREMRETKDRYVEVNFMNSWLDIENRIYGAENCRPVDSAEGIAKVDK